MGVALDDVRRVAALAKLQFSPGEEERLTGELNRILQYMEKLNALDTEGVEPATHAVPIANAFRDDVPEDFPHVEDLLAQAPEMQERYFKVPRIIE